VTGFANLDRKPRKKY